jgi:hypothetical protein
MVARMLLPPPGAKGDRILVLSLRFRHSRIRRDARSTFHGPSKGFEATAPLVALQRSQSPADARPSRPGPPTHAIAGARSRSHRGHRAATVTPQSLQWLMSTEKEDQPRSARRAEDEARVLFH